MYSPLLDLRSSRNPEHAKFVVTDNGQTCHNTLSKFHFLINDRANSIFGSFHVIWNVSLLSSFSFSYFIITENSLRISWLNSQQNLGTCQHWWQCFSMCLKILGSVAPVSIDALMIASVNISNAEHQAKHDIGRHGGDDTKDAF